MCVCVVKSIVFHAESARARETLFREKGFYLVKKGAVAESFVWGMVSGFESSS